MHFTSKTWPTLGWSVTQSLRPSAAFSNPHVDQNKQLGFSRKVAFSEAAVQVPLSTSGTLLQYRLYLTSPAAFVQSK